MAAAGDSCRGGASQPEMLGYRVASPSDVNKAVPLQIKAEIKQNAAITPAGRAVYARVVLSARLWRVVTVAASTN